MEVLELVVTGWIFGFRVSTSFFSSSRGGKFVKMADPAAVAARYQKAIIKNQEMPLDLVFGYCVLLVETTS